MPPRPAPARRAGRRRTRVLARAVTALLLCGASLAVGIGTAVPSSADEGSPVTVRRPDGSTVTVSQTRDLVHQALHVSWTKFPTTTPDPVSPLYGGDNYVWVMQCRGPAPRREDCFLGANTLVSTRNTQQGYIQFLDPQGTPVVPYELGSGNEKFAETSAQGTGQTDLEIRTDALFPVLDCHPDAAATCSVVVATASPGTRSPFEKINWDKRVTVPLTFAATAESCDVRNPDAVLQGAPAAQSVLESWQAGLCTQAARVDAVYVSTNEANARQDFLSGAANNAGTPDAALTVRPVDGDLTRPGAYAPLAVSGIGIGFLVDDVVTRQQLTSLRLNARLIAKVLTQSYGIVTDNPATQGNPTTFGEDPEIRDLNPTLPEFTLSNAPIMLSGDSDLIYELTRWVDADPEARSFLDGQPDPWGMHVSTLYKGLALPVSELELRDGYTSQFTAPGGSLCKWLPVQDQYPLLSLSAVAASVVTGDSHTRVAPDFDVPTGTCVQRLVGPTIQGHRRALGLMDTATAAALRIPMASLVNSKGAAVPPTASSMGVGLASMDVNPDGVTRQVNTDKLPASGYPLTIATSALVATSGLPTGTDSRAEKVARVLDHAAGAGQEPGVKVGELPAGYVPLPQSLRDLTTTAAAAVRAQNGTLAVPAGPDLPVGPAGPPGEAGAPGPPGADGNVSTALNPAGSASTPLDGSGTAPAVDATAATANTGPAAAGTPVATAVAQPRGSRTVATTLRWALPVLLLLGLASGVAGTVLNRGPGSMSGWPMSSWQAVRRTGGHVLRRGGGAR